MVENKELQHEQSLEKNGKNFTSKTGSDLDLEKISEGQSSDRCTQIFGENASLKVQELLLKIQKLKALEDDQRYCLKLPLYSSDDHIGAPERDSAVSTMKSMHRFYNYGSETLATGVSYLDRIISKVKVKRRYLSCVAAASFFLAIKMNEEPEFHPSASDLASLNRFCWKPSDLKRMEKIILDKLEWKMFPAVTCLSYLEVIYQILELVRVDVDETFLKQLIDRSELYMNYTSCSIYNPCTLAVSVTRQCLKEVGLCSVITSYILLHIQSICQVPDSEYFECQCAISKQYQMYNLHPESRARCLPLPKMVPRPSLVTRPSCYGSSDLPTIQEVPWSCESREEEDMLPSQNFVHGQVVHYLPFPGTEGHKMSQSYCLLLDQCVNSETGFRFCNTKCNMSIL